MLKRLFFLTTLLGLLCYNTVQATALLLDPLDGAITGQPDSTIGWGFNLSNNENYLIVTSAVFESTKSWGRFTDFISTSNFFVVGSASNASTVWAQTFDNTKQTGIGSFVIDAGAEAGSVNRGQIVLTYDLFSRSPLDALFNPDTDTLSNGNILATHASVTVAIVPLPAAVWLFGSILACLFGFTYRR